MKMYEWFLMFFLFCFYFKILKTEWYLICQVKKSVPEELSAIFLMQESHNLNIGVNTRAQTA